MAKKLNIGGVEILNIESLAKTADVNAAISEALSGVFVIVPNVAAVNAPGKIYLVKMATADGADNAYDEYLYINGKAEHIGSTKLDLVGYAKTADMTSAIATAKTEAINTAATTAQSKADAAKTAAISAAATDAQTKANNAKTAAVADAKTYADGKFAAVVSLTQAEYDALSTKDPRTIYIIN